MGLNTATVAVHTTPTVISTFLKHVTGANKHKSRRTKRTHAPAESTTQAGASVNAAANPDDVRGQKEVSALAQVHEWPDENVLYDEGLQIVKRFLKVAKGHTVEDLQSFTAMHVPSPNWIHITRAAIPPSNVTLAGQLLSKHFHDVYSGVSDLGGENWWTLRGKDLEGEWIEMRKDYLKRTVSKAEVAVGEKEEPYRQDEKVILYIHGGAFFFSSLDTHRYQIQRHARKLGGRAFSPSYRLAPQYPFPCGLHDALASYLYLVSPPPNSPHPPISPANIIVSGDSAGAGLVLALLCVIRDSGGQVPMPAGATLISPWVDLTHSFKSIMEDDARDYIPSEGFHYKPSLAWPPIKGDAISVEVKDPQTGKMEERVLDEQVQMYASNRMLGHPLVSPVNQGSLGGLCPLMIMGGSGELLRDEMIFLAHKAADPARYPPAEAVLERFPAQREMVHKFPPTKVQLQIYDGAAHVTPTLSFTGPAKVMYRAAANFGLWALTVAGIKDDQEHDRTQRKASHHRTKKTPSGRSSTRDSGRSSSDSEGGSRTKYGTTMTTLDGDVVAAPTSDSVHELANARAHDEEFGSEASSSSSSGSESEEDHPAVGAPAGGQDVVSATGTMKKFVGSMIRERVDVRGRIRPFEPVDECATFIGLDLQGVGQVHGAGPIVKWLAARAEWDAKFKKELASFRELKTADRALAEQGGFLTRNLTGERPPLASLAGWSSEEYATKASASVDRVGPHQAGRKNVSGVVALWMRMGEKDESKRAKKAEVKVDALTDRLDELGVGKNEQDLLGDQKPDAVRRHMEDQGVDVVPHPVEEVGPGGENLRAVGERIDTDEGLQDDREMREGQRKLPPPKDVTLGNAL